MKDRTLMDTKGWGRSVHTIQQMPAPQVRNADHTMQAIAAQRQESTSAGRRG
jgi:dihydroorotase